MWRRSRSSPQRSSSTSEGGRAPAALAVAAFLAFAAAVAGCSAFDTLRAPPAARPDRAAAAKPAAPEPPKRIAFDHKFHLDKGVGCADCHEGIETAGKPAMPTAEFCMNCHVDIDDQKPKERRIAAFLDKPGGNAQWSRVTAQAPGVVFAHENHVAKKVACAECHAGIEKSTAVTKELLTDMDACTKCHAAKGAKNECATCHKEAAESVAAGKGQYWAPANHAKAAWQAEHGAVATRGGRRGQAERCELCHGTNTGPSSCVQCHTTRRPADHERIWTTLHGQAVRADPAQATGRCAYCHDATGFPRQSKCLGCHATEAPRDHSQSWRVNAGHGLAAALDRARCETCHRTDSCVACHQSMQPRNHRGGWGAPRDTHCAGCHLPLSEDQPGGCAVCHQGTPSHSAAPRMPAQPPHRPDMQCRQCHNGPPKLRHFDNGTNCLICHK